MRRPLAVLLLFCTIAATDLHAQITSNVFQRVLMIRVGGATGETGTAFTMDVDGRQYLITAKHMVANSKAEDSIEILKSSGWSALDVKVFRCADPVDIAVLVPPSVLTVTFRLEPLGETKMIVAGQDAYFVGYPYGLSMSTNGPSPLALTKKGIVSAFMGVGTNGDMILLDGYNNPGFSGAPIVFRDVVHPGDPDLYVAGVISGFRPDYASVTRPEPIPPGTDVSKIESWRLVKNQNGDALELKDTGEVVALNTGIVQGYMIRYAIDLIHEHPIGPTIPK